MIRDPMSFTFDELLSWAPPLEMVVDHRKKTLETMEVLQNEWKAKCLVRNAAFCRSKEIKWLKRKLEMLTEASDDTAEQKIELEMEITRLESETLKERTQQKKEEDRKKEEVRQRKEEDKDRKKEEARQQEEEKDRKKEEAQQQKEVENDRMKEMKEMKEAACKHVGCDNDVWARGVCHKHAAAEKRAKIVT